MRKNISVIKDDRGLPQRILDHVETCEGKKNGTTSDLLGFLHYPQFHE